MTATRTLLELARTAREAGVCALLGRGEAGASPVGMAAPGAILATGRDVLEFLHSQVTNDVRGLTPGEGNCSARVTRTGQLVDLFSLHRLPDGETPALLLLLEAERVAPLLEDLERVLFADDVVLRDVTADYAWSILQGPRAARAAAHAVADGLPEGSSEADWEALPAYALRTLALADASRPGLVISRSLTGDAGLVFALPREVAARGALESALVEQARARGFAIVAEPALSPLLELLRVEAGLVRIGPETSGRKRILPETGLEGQAVSYTKGCYLGQEVIARVRTYGSLPFSLRGLVLQASEAGPDDWDVREALLACLPAPGERLELESGEGVGQIASRALSPTADAAIAFAYLDKTHRTPGHELVLRGASGPLRARVTLLPFYSAPDRTRRVAHLYDHAVRVFAAGDEARALTLLEEALGLDPGFADGYEALGVMLGRSQRFHEAIDIFKRLEEIAPQEPMVNTNLSLYFMKLGDKQTAEDEAARALQKSMARSAGRSVDGRVLEEAMAEQKRADARRKREMFAQVLEIDPDDPIALFGLGNALSVLGEWEEAVRVYSHACRVDKDGSAVHLALGKALERLGREAEAERVYREGMEVASRRGDLMPLKEMEHRVLLLSGPRSPRPADAVASSEEG